MGVIVGAGKLRVSNKCTVLALTAPLAGGVRAVMSPHAHPGFLEGRWVAKPAGAWEVMLLHRASPPHPHLGTPKPTPSTGRPPNLEKTHCQPPPKNPRLLLPPKLPLPKILGQTGLPWQARSLANRNAKQAEPALPAVTQSSRHGNPAPGAMLGFRDPTLRQLHGRDPLAGREDRLQPGSGFASRTKLIRDLFLMDAPAIFL